MPLKQGKTSQQPQLASLHGLPPNWAKKCYKTGEKTPKGQMVPISCAHGGPSKHQLGSDPHLGAPQKIQVNQALPWSTMHRWCLAEEASAIQTTVNDAAHRIASGTHIRIGDRFFRVACLQNETAPEKLLNRYEKRFEKREKGSEKRSETRPKQIQPLSGRLKIFHQHFSTNLKKFFTA